MDNVEVINLIIYLRNRANLSARALSIRIGKNPGYINRLEAKKILCLQSILSSI